MIYDFDTLPDRRASESLKWRRYEADVLPLWIADMDFPSPQPVIQALRQRVEHGVFGYPPGGSGDWSQLRQLLVERLWERYRWQVSPEAIVFQSGVIPAFHLACLAFASKRKAVLVQPPVYEPILKAAATSAVRGVEAELVRKADGTYEVDWEVFQAAFEQPIGLFLLCNPHNPIGKTYNAAELERMALTCLRHRVVICSDEIHCELLYTGQRHIPIASLDAEIAANTITLMSPSKTFNLAGLRFSFAIIPNPDLRQRYLGAARGLMSGLNLMGLTAAEAAYRYGQEWLEQLLVYLEKIRDFLYEYVSTQLPGVHMAKPQATYLAWLDCRAATIPDNPYEFFLRQARVALVDGKVFGHGGEGFVRLNFGCPRPLLIEALDRMRLALESLPQRAPSEAHS